MCLLTTVVRRETNYERELLKHISLAITGHCFSNKPTKLDRKLLLLTESKFDFEWLQLQVPKSHKATSNGNNVVCPCYPSTPMPPVANFNARIQLNLSLRINSLACSLKQHEFWGFSTPILLHT